ncbi:hypothetical protein LTR37_007150 [Vermiconidia calcicola]|uniref:Uncharacterized protein n=1 Tax=Vermiconidia calcicola TaxID=1690605 RepID=A0ACC3NEK8_9PEZI|nr:hypothetical protein LTR37_007150 [Vermiconidia calcicola]
MFTTNVIALIAALPVALSQTRNDETILGVYMLHRHGDRTAKITAPANLTDLGYRQVYTSGEYYRNRYIAEDSTYRISGINSDVVLQSQLQVSAPIDAVLQNSATGFLQALYPPVGASANTEALRNGAKVTAPMEGYQLVPIGVAESGSGSEDSTWLQGTSDCARAEISSNQYFSSDEFNEMMSQTEDFYSRLLPVISGEFNETTANFEDAYTIFDYINVATIHNATISSEHLLDEETLSQLRTLADNHEWNLAYNASNRIRAVAGMTLAAQIVQFLETTIEDAGAETGQKLGVQFGAYATFAAFFGLADLHSVDVDFTGVTDYASSMVFEMFTKTSDAVTAENYPSEHDIYVRFLYHNGTATEDSPPTPYPLFGSGREALSWTDFSSSMNEFALGDTGSWCVACGNFTGECAAYNSDPSGSGSDTVSENEESCSNGMSATVNGVIGALVTLAVILGLEALVILIFGLRVVSKKTLAQASPGGVEKGF